MRCSDPCCGLSAHAGSSITMQLPAICGKLSAGRPELSMCRTPGPARAADDLQGAGEATGTDLYPYTSCRRAAPGGRSPRFRTADVRTGTKGARWACGWSRAAARWPDIALLRTGCSKGPGLTRPGPRRRTPPFAPRAPGAVRSGAHGRVRIASDALGQDSGPACAAHRRTVSTRGGSGPGRVSRCRTRSRRRRPTSARVARAVRGSTRAGGRRRGAGCTRGAGAGRRCGRTPAGSGPSGRVRPW